MANFYFECQQIRNLKIGLATMAIISVNQSVIHSVSQSFHTIDVFFKYHETIKYVNVIKFAQKNLILI